MKYFLAFLRKGNHFWGELLSLVILQIFASCILAGPFAIRGTLAGDAARQFGLFRDNLHSLNWFGEIQWWNPSQASMGFPIYYLSVLATVFTSPLFAMLAAVVWLLGSLGIHLSSYLSLYVFYFGFLLPLLVSFSFLLFTRQIFRDYRVLLFLIPISVF